MEKELIYSISELNGLARALLETELGSVWVQGEISNLARPSSGHLYFTLKDAGAQVRCAFFRMNQRQLNFTLENGQQILAKASVSLYEGRGDYQLIVNTLQLAGNGALQQAFEALKKTLAAQGLFDTAHKRPIPTLARCIGVITSHTGAALRDILHVLKRRSPSTPVMIYPCLVQGELAKTKIVEAILTANQRRECDVLILARGGGSLEDLWPFNEASVAHAIFNSTIPIVTGVGHEVDITIADFVADYRAPTPSAAAEYVSRDRAELMQQLKHIEQHITRSILNVLMQYSHQVASLQKRLRHPREKLREQTQMLDHIEQQLQRSIQYKLISLHATLRELSGKLDALSPLSTLKRGYAILTDAQHHPIDSVHKVMQDDSVLAKLSDGTLTCRVQSVQQVKSSER